MNSGSLGESKKELSPKPSSVDKRSYVVAGAILSCSYGSLPSRLNMQMSHGVYVKGKPIMNVMDYVPNVNIMSFGACRSTVNPAVIAATVAMGGIPQQVPCMPIVTMPWLGGKTDKTIDSFPSLLNDSTNMCMFCGKIKIEDDGQNLEYVPLLEKCMNTGEMQGPPEDTRAWYEKAWDGIAQTGEDIWSGVKKTGNSFAEIGTDFWNGLGVRANKAFDSPYDFGNWLTVGAFDVAGGIVEGYKTRGDKRNESTYDYVNWLSSGMADMFKGAFNPDDPLSKEHWMNSFGVFASVAGARGVVPKNGGSTLPKVKVPEKTPVPKVEERSSPNINKQQHGTIEKKQVGSNKSRLPDEMLGKNDADPFRDIYGPGRLSHTEEWNSIIKHAQEAGVEVRILDRDIMAYAPKGSGPGQLNIYKDASISALRHEYQHFLDDMTKGYPKLDVTYEFKNRIIMELRAYMVEIKEAERIGNKSLADHLWNNYREERQYLIDNFGPIKE